LAAAQHAVGSRAMQVVAAVTAVAVTGKFDK
jgi:hypothetical protein